jgi:hypothetical protein
MPPFLPGGSGLARGRGPSGPRRPDEPSGGGAQCIRPRLVPPLRLVVLRPPVLRLPVLRLLPVPDRLLLRVVPWRDAALFVLRLAVVLLPFEREVAFLAVRDAVPFDAPLRVLRAEPADFERDAVADLARVPDAVLRVPDAALRVPEAALRLRVLVADFARVVLAPLRVDLLALAVFRPVPEEAADLPRPPALFRPPFAAAAVRPAAPRDELLDALRVPDADFARVPLLLPEALRLLVLRELLPVLRRAGARRRRGCSSPDCCVPPSPLFSDCAGICSVSSLMC